jgi:hypothetical protein
MPTPYHPSFYAPPAGWDDPLRAAAARFVAAHRCVGPGAVMRRFKVGPIRAARLMEALRVSRLFMGGPWRRVYRVNPHAWAALQGDVTGAVGTLSGDVHCQAIGGAVSTLSGDIVRAPSAGASA